MHKTRNTIFQLENENGRNIKKDRILWWMKKYKNSIYVPFVNNINVI